MVRSNRAKRSKSTTPKPRLGITRLLTLLSIITLIAIISLNFSVYNDESLYNLTSDAKERINFTNDDKNTFKRKTSNDGFKIQNTIVGDGAVTQIDVAKDDEIPKKSTSNDGVKIKDAEGDGIVTDNDDDTNEVEEQGKENNSQGQGAVRNHPLKSVNTIDISHIFSTSTTTQTGNKKVSKPTKKDLKINDPNDYNGDEDDDDDKSRIRNILKSAEIEIKPELNARLPTWSEVTSLYGSEPIILGLETCKDFQQNVPETDYNIAAAGLFNTGTNYLKDLLKKNCSFPKRKPKEGLLFQVPWGKHNPVDAFRLKHSAEGNSININQHHVLPIVMIKDPYQWMGSMCRHKYSAKWAREKYCPNLTKNGEPVPVTVRYKEHHIPEYASMVEWWNDWYSQYIKADDFPRLIIRYEDLLFHIDYVLPKVCTCAGGKLKEGDIKRPTESSKAHHKGSNGLQSAILRYGHDKSRIAIFRKYDLEFSRDTLNEDMMKLFAYTHPGL